MGLAVLIDQENCLAFQGLRCEVCYRVCPLHGEGDLVWRCGRRSARASTPTSCRWSIRKSLHGLRKMRERSCILEEPAIQGDASRELAKGRLGEHYRFGWKEEPVISRDFATPSKAHEDPGGVSVVSSA